MSMLQSITVDVQSQDIGSPIALDETPLLAGRKALLHIPTLPLTGVFELQGAPRFDPATNATPIEGSVLWETIVEITSASPHLQEITLPDHIRWETTTADGDGPDVLVYLEGVQ